mgnify:CR=1 FL=1
MDECRVRNQGLDRIGQVEAARQLGISLNRLNEIVIGKRGISADTYAAVNIEF